MRYLSERLRADLGKKLVLLAGPRQCGKTHFAKSLLDAKGEYLNWDVSSHRQIVRRIAWPKDASLVVLDELHKAPKWRNFLKGIVDEFGNRPPLLVAGSARLDAFRRSGDALTERHYFYRLHPVDIAESSLLLPDMGLPQRVQRLLTAGGFPEALLNPGDADRLRNERLELVTREDLRDLTRISSWRGPADLIELLRDRVGQAINYDNLSQSLGVSPPTIKSWVELLEKLYIIFLLPPYSRQLSRSIRKNRRVYFSDCAAATDATGGARLENLVACGLLKFIQFRRDAAGEQWDLHYLRDKEQREVDFVVTRNRQVEWLIEVKTADTNVGKGLAYYNAKLKPDQSIQLVLNAERPLELNGIKVVPLAPWMSALR